MLAEDNQKEIVKFCKDEGLVLLADEVSIFLRARLVPFYPQKNKCTSIEIR